MQFSLKNQLLGARLRGQTLLEPRGFIMSALRKFVEVTEASDVADMTMGLGADLMPCSNIEGTEMILGGGVALMPASNIETGVAADLMPCSNIEGETMVAGAGVALMPCSN
jgi:hypothetical protein